MAMETGDQQRECEYAIILPIELIRQIAIAVPEDIVRRGNRISRTFDHFADERGKAALAAEIADRRKEGEEEGQLEKIKCILLLQASVEGNIWRVRQLLMEMNADWLKQNGHCPFHFIIDEKTAVPVVKLLLEHGFPVDAKWSFCNGSSPLPISAARGHLRVRHLLIKNRWWYLSTTPLHIAARHGNLDVCRLLLENGANANAEDENGVRPLSLSAANGHVEIVKSLLQNGAKVDAADKWGETALHKAARKSHMEIAKILVENVKKSGMEATKALLDAMDVRRNTALHLAYFDYHLDLARMLEERGADENIRNHIGKRPFEFCRFSI